MASWLQTASAGFPDWETMFGEVSARQNLP
jgi:hypothetical protein